MAVGPIENATIARMQDVSMIKHNEDMKTVVNQGHINTKVQKTQEEKNHVVQKKDDTGMAKNNQDARDKGSSEYRGDGGIHRKKQPSDKVVVKNKPSGFDIKI